MKNLHGLVLSAWISLLIFSSGCERSSLREIDIVHIDGIQWACNITSSYGAFGSTIETEGQNKVTLAAANGDLLYMLWDDLEFYYRYNHRDGQDLNVLFDTLGLVSVYVNGELNYMEITGPSIPAAFKDLRTLEMSHLSTLRLSASLVSDLIPFLEENESQLQLKGLVMENSSGSEDLAELLGTYQPEFLVLEDPWQLPSPNSDYVLEGLELLWIQGYTSTLARAAQCCSDLESLILSEWESKPGELLPLSSMKNLQNLTLAESDLPSLQNIEFPDDLQSLNLITCENLHKIDQILHLPKLCRLNMTGCENLKKLGMIQDLNSLRWISFPPGISQVEFQELTGELKQLELIELIGCEEIIDLHPLQSLENLSVLALDLEKDQLSGVDSLKQLELLIVSDKLFTDIPDYISELRSALPNTKVVPGSGLCLGSGWLLLLLPLILLFRYTFRRKFVSSDSK